MKKIMASRGGSLIAILSLLYTISMSGQTLSLNDGSILRSNPSRIGINLGSVNYYDNGQMLKNLIGSMNPGFEPSQQRQIWNLSPSASFVGTTNSFTVPDQYDGVPANYWAGGTFTVVASESGGTTGCSGTIASNTGPNYPTWVGSTSPVITVSSPCAGAFAVGDIVILSKTFTPTPEAWWEASEGGFWGGVSGGGKLTSNTTDLCATCGTQTLDLDATAAGSSANANFYFDTDSNDVFVLMNGTFQLSLWAKTAAGTPVMNVSAARGAAGGFNCGIYTPTLNSTWTQYTYTCNASETKSGTAIGNAGVKVSVSGGSAYLDNVSFMKVAPSDSSNPTVFRDEVIDTLKQFATPSANNRGVLRYWLNQNAETAYNWTQPDYARNIVASGTGYFAQPSGGASITLSLEDYLEICQTVGVDPYFVVPITFTTTDAADLIEFLAGSSSTTYGARRAALGQMEPWTSVFNTIHLEFGNESWNFSSFAGQALPSRANAPSAANPEYYYDYSVRAAQIFAAMRGAQDYSPSSFDLVLNAQTAVNWSMDTGIARSHPDSIEVEGYLYQTLTSFATDAALWGPAMFEPYENVTNPSDVANFYQSVHDYQSQTTCGATGTATCKLNVYEWGQGTLPGSGIDQAHLDYINAGAGQAVINALEPLLKIQYYGIGPQSLFSLAEYQQNGNPAPKLWGTVVDMGGATNNVRPNFLGPQLVNQSIIGPMFSCPITNNPTYNFAGSANGPGAALPAMTNVPYIYSFCFMNGNQRSIVLINTDLSNSRKVSFAGTNMPTGAVSVRQIAPSSLDALNEAPTGTPTNQTAATVAIDTSSLSSPSSITLPPYSVTALDYTAAGSGSTTLPQPTFSPAGGTYTGAQTVSISDSTAGATVYYTTDGSTPTTSSAVYGSPVTVGASETLNAIAVESGYTNSPVASAAYTISSTLPTPVISPSGGSYTSSQTVSISDSTAGATIYYTTDGSTPTTSSSVYGGSVTVSASETVNAIAVKSGSSNSAVASAVYTINSTLPAPVISPSGGSYTSSQTVSISDSTAGATIYYTTDGSTPTTSSSVYGGSVTVSASETVNAIAVKSGSSNSAVASAVYTINSTLPAPVISPSGGTYTSSQTVSISDATTGTTIYYTTNGSTPTTSSSVYGGPITVSASETLNAIAVKGGSSNSAVASAAYTINSTLPAPVISPSGGTYTSTQTVSISDSTTGTTIYYTTNGSTPTTSSSVYGGSITVSASETVNAIAVKSGSSNSAVASAAYTINSTLPTPVISPSGGTYTSTQSVSISDSTAGTTIFYTTDGSTPTTSSSVYGGSITVSASETVNAIAVKSGSSNSAVASAVYTINSTLPAPVISPSGGTYTSSQTVSISDATTGTTIYYTTNGSTPTTSSSVYGGPITVSASETLNAIAVKGGSSNSAVASAAYTINSTLPAPVISPSGGTYSSAQTVSISDSTTGTTIYYTTDGSTPTTSSAIYGSPLTVSASETVNAIAGKSGSSNSAVASAAYTINSALPPPTFNPGPGTYPTSQSVSIAEGMTGSTIYYTTDGSVPTTSSHVYTSPVMVEASTTMKAVAVKSGHAASAAALASYTIQPILPSPSFSPASGTFSTPQTVSISDASAGTTIYYTINGTPPTTSSALYTGPVQVDASETLQAIAVESGHTNSKAATAAYTIGTALSAPTFLPGSGTYNVAQVVTLSEATAGATIYYTTNGSTPTTSSPVYSGPITVSSSETIKATAIATGYSQSGVSSAGYTIRLKKTPKVKLAASSASVSTAEPLNIVVQVSSDSGQPTPTGTVSLAGGEFSSTAVLANGIATISVPAGSLPQGKDTLTGTYTPDAASSSTCTDATSTAVITVIQANYTLAGSALALAPGQSAKAPVTVSSTSDFTGSVSLSCSVTASPAGAVNLPTCAGSNSTVSLDSSKPKQVAYVALNTTAPENLATTKPNSMKGFGEGAALALLALFGIPAKRRKIQSLLCVLILAGLMGGVVGCGGTVTHNSTPGSSASQGTTAGDYTITVTGTGSDSAKSKASATFTLTVN